MKFKVGDIVVSTSSDRTGHRFRIEEITTNSNGKTVYWEDDIQNGFYEEELAFPPKVTNLQEVINKEVDKLTG